MTNFEAISASLYPYDVDDALKEKVCIDQGLDARWEYSDDFKVPVAKATIAVLRHLLVLSGESNGGYSLSYDTDNLCRRLVSLARENGLVGIADEYDSRSKIADKSCRW